MKKTLSILFAILMAVTVNAQQGHEGQQGQRKQFDPTQMATRRAQQLKDSLGLSDKQYNQILTIYQDEAKEMQQMMEQRKSAKTDANTGASEQTTTKKSDKKADKSKQGENPMKARQEAQDAKIKAVLTLEQYTKYQQMQKNRRRGGMRGPGNGRQGMNGGPQGGPQAPCANAPRRSQGCCCCNCRR